MASTEPMDTATFPPALCAAFARLETYARSNSEHFLQKHHNLVAASFAPKFVLKSHAAFAVSPCEPVSVFHTRQYISMPLSDMAQRLVKYLRLGHEELATALVLCARFATASQPITWHMLHRLFVSSLHVAMKAHSDRFFTLSAFAKASGVLPHELARLEVAFATAIRFRCAVLLSPAELAAAPSPLEAVLHVAASGMRTALIADGDRSDSEFTLYVSGPTDEIEEEEDERRSREAHPAPQTHGLGTNDVGSSPRSVSASPTARTCPVP